MSDTPSEPDTAQILALLEKQAEQSRYAMELRVQRAWDDEMAKPRNADPKRLLRHGYKVYSQNDEDGIIAEIFRRIGTTSRTFVEFGVETGVECNTAKLLIEGWRGLWIEANAASAAAIRQNLAPFIADRRLVLEESRVTAENINGLIGQGGLSGEIDLLAVDIDGNDYWVWKAIDVVTPRVVVIEYNATLRPPMALVVPYRADAQWDGSNHYGASLEALVRLATAKNYRLVGCSIAGVNAFFVRADLAGDRFLVPATAQEHYEPPRHYFHMLPSGHRSRPGPFVAV
jgi:hypothetical protein